MTVMIVRRSVVDKGDVVTVGVVPMRHKTITTPKVTCPFRKSYPDVLAMQPCQDGNSDNGTRPLDGSTQECIFL